jgi:hypothetical protein
MNRVERKEPSDLQKALVNEGTYLRGRILAAYAQMEFLLADLTVKLDLKFPYLVTKRIKTAKDIANRPGYEAYRDDLVKVCDDLLQYDEMRNIMAHGFMMLTVDKQGNHVFDMMMYRRSGDKFDRLEVQTTVERMQMASDDIIAYVQDAVRLFSRIYLEKRLEHPVDGILTEKKGPSEGL